MNDTIDLQLLDDAIPEDKDEYRVLLSDIKTFGNAGLYSLSLLCKIVQQCYVATQCNVPLTLIQVLRHQDMLPWICRTGTPSSQWIPVMSPMGFSPLPHRL